MINLLQDLDELIQTGKKFLLGKWIADAKSWGTTEGVCLRLDNLPKRMAVKFLNCFCKIYRKNYSTSGMLEIKSLSGVHEERYEITPPKSGPE